MPGSATAPPVIDDALASFLDEGVTILIGSRDAANVPSVALATACRVAADRSTVTVFLARSRAGCVLDDLAATGTIAAVFSLPSSHRTYQLKGRVVAPAPPRADDGERIVRHVHAIAGELAPLGETAAFTHALFDVAADDLVAVTFAPTAAFDQTPGPRAGTPLGAAP